MHEIALPLYVCGEPLEGDQVRLEVLGSDGPTRLLLPAISPEELARVRRGPAHLAELPLAEILDFLRRASAIWSDEQHPLVREALELSRRVTGFSEPELRLDLSYIAGLLDPQRFLLPTLAAALDDASVLDGWVSRGGSEVRAFPLGRVLHLLAGNVPGVEALSLVRALLTKNASLLKLASGNPITPLFLMRSLLQIDPRHPICRATSVLYWPHGAAAEAAAFGLADAVCVWGGAPAVAAAWRAAHPGQLLLDYGPKRSLAFIDAASVRERPGEVAAALAWDLCVHDQLACHSPQIAFVERPAATLLGVLGEALQATGRQHPKGFVSLDHQAEIAHLRSLSEIRGDRVLCAADGEWTLILTADVARARRTPLSRTLFLVEVDDLREAAAHADRTTMVVGFSSAQRLEELRDRLALRGVDRLTCLGQMGLPPPGFPHEGRYDLTRLVRFVGVDGHAPGSTSR